ncbi:hypothetical protein E2C01_030053 [Portunus trituberculatus]|uniref:Uncharacterized protein n=1 Tax=Portunus trituberculatus TaxID=210409 RepID=A0A5B7EPH1_PORTR|nr:hypothetical protein [Portunus trituberculatus]
MGRLCLGGADGSLGVGGQSLGEPERGKQNIGEEEETFKVLIDNKFALYFTVKTLHLWYTTHVRLHTLPGASAASADRGRKEEAQRKNKQQQNCWPLRGCL